jgi:hypothetical protein
MRIHFGNIFIWLDTECRKPQSELLSSSIRKPEMGEPVGDTADFDLCC